MYTGSNPTALHSQECFANALLELLKEEDYIKITIKDICIKAGLTRQTFYQLFQIKDDIISFCIKKRFHNLKQLHENKDFDETATLIANNMKQDRAFFQLLYDHHLGQLLGDELSSVLTSIADEICPDRDEKERRIAIAFITGGLMRSLFVWLQSDDITQQDFIQLLHHILTNISMWTLPHK